jgi:hypothetical protein
MKRFILLLAAGAILVLSGCSTSAVEKEAAAAMGTDESAQTASRLMMLTFALEDTDLAVTPQQAQDLLPLWKTYRAVTSSDNAASQELEALNNQIQETMTAAQLAVMEDGDFDNQAFARIMQEYGGGMQRARSDSDSSSDFQGPGSGEIGGRPGGGGEMPGGGGGAPAELGSGAGMAAMDSEDQENMPAGSGGGMMTGLIDPFIDLLEARAAE